MDNHSWAVDKILNNMRCIDACVLLRKLGLDNEYIAVVGMAGKYTLKDIVFKHRLITRKINTITLQVGFKGGPHWREKTCFYVTSLKDYVADRVLQACLTTGHDKVSHIFDEIFGQPA
jgi:hypothetical protein